MIVVYPMIVSSAVSENTLPALSKMLEHYVLVYMQNDLIDQVNRHAKKSPQAKLRYKVKGKKFVGESIELNEVDRTGEYEPGTKKTKEETKPEKEPSERERIATADREAKAEEKEKDRAIRAGEREQDRVEKEAEKKAEKEKEAAKGQKVSIKISDKAISLEPTTIAVETDKYGTQFIGVKVVPYRVISDAKLSHLIMHDMKIKGISALTLPFGRKVLGAILRFTKKGPVSGDPKRDIIYRTTGYKGETFVVLEKNHDVDETFLKNTKRINRLFKLGWGNFVIADDALQIAHFCLRATKGICQGMSYRMMYKTLGQSGIYEDLEDLRKQNSSLFKVRAQRFSKLLGESKVDTKLFNYQERQ